MAVYRLLGGLIFLMALLATAMAGPVESELRSRQGDVATPDMRPSANTKSVPDDVLPRDISGGDNASQGAPAQAETTLPAPRGADGTTRIQTQRQPAEPLEETPEIAKPARGKAIDKKPEAEADPVAIARPQRTLDTQCIAKLAALSDAQSTSSPKGKFDECRIQQPVSVGSFSGPLPVSLSTQATVDCAFATEFSNYINFRAQPLAQIHLETQLTKITAGSGFQCRRRNNAPTGKLSEHAFGYAIDILSFTFADGTTIDVRDPGQMDKREAAYFNAVRKGACDYFTTVLGPGSDAAHATHLHLDLGRSIGNPNPYRICE